MWLANKRKPAAAAALLMAVLSLSACGTQTVVSQDTILHGAAAEKVKSYETFEVTGQNVTKSGSLTLTVGYAQKQTLYAPDSNLYFSEMIAQRKSVVREGELIAVFHYRGSQADLDEAQLNLSRAIENRDALLEMKQTAIDNANAMAGSELGDIQLQLAQLDYERTDYMLGQQIAQLERAVADAQAKFEDVYLYAPYDCVLDSTARLYPEQEVDPTTAVAEISRLDSMILSGETSTSTFQFGNQIEVEYGKKDKRERVPARVVSTSKLLGEPGSKVYVVLDEPMDEDKLTKPTAKNEIVQIQDALAVPRSSIESENGIHYVHILVDGVAHKRYIIRGITVGSAGENQAVVLSGLEEGQLVITN